MFARCCPRPNRLPAMAQRFGARCLSAITARGRTALYDAVAQGLQYADAGMHERKVLIAVSDGGDNASTATFDEIVRQAQRSNALIYTVVVRDPLESEANPRRLKRLAEQSGGEAFEPHDIGEVPFVLQHIARDIRNMYTLGYAPSAEQGAGPAARSCPCRGAGRWLASRAHARRVSRREEEVTVPRRFLLFVLRWLQRAHVSRGRRLRGMAVCDMAGGDLLPAVRAHRAAEPDHGREGAADGFAELAGTAASRRIGHRPARRAEALAVDACAIEGDDERTLRIAAGHLPDTPLPWQDGNASFAGHRDTFFRALRDVRVGDDISIATTHGAFSYRVTRTLIVNPGDLSVLQPHDGTALTLITCYPFTYLGDAPQRFVVQAERFDDAG